MRHVTHHAHAASARTGSFGAFRMTKTNRRPHTWTFPQISFATMAFASLLAVTGFQMSGLRPAVQLPMRAAPQMAQLEPPRAASSVIAAGLALALSTANPTLTHAAIEQPAVVQQYGASMVAESDAELREAQAKFLAERQKLAQTYEASTDPTFKGADETQGKKSIYVTIVGGLVLLAVVAPMLQFFYYTGGD